jgi:P4 family phage/plasmid primase-like protien
MLTQSDYTTKYLQRALYTNDEIDEPDPVQANGTFEVLEAIYYVRQSGGTEKARAIWENTIRHQRPDVAKMLADESGDDEGDDTMPDKPDDDQLANAIKKLWRNKVAFIHADWHVYEGCWRKRQQSETHLFIRQALRRWRSKQVKVSQSRIKALSAMLEDDCMVTDRAIIQTADERKKYIPLRNGLFNIQNMEMERDNPELYFTTQLDFNYDPSADCPNFKKFLASSLVLGENNTETDFAMIEFLQEALAYSMTSRTDLKASFWLYGKPDSGKSTLLSIIRSLMGELHGTIDLNSLGGNRFMLSAIVGTRVVTFSEADQGVVLPDGLYKALVGGTDEIFADIKNKPGIVFVPEAKLWWGMNNMPRTTDRSGATLNRLNPILFNRSIPKHERIHNLDLMIHKERSGIFNWLMAGYQRLVTNRHFTEVPQALAWKEEYRMSNDTELSFVNEACELIPDERTQSQELYSHYRTWCENNGFKPKNANQIAIEWQRLGLQKKGINGRNFWYGIKIAKNYTGVL